MTSELNLLPKISIQIDPMNNYVDELYRAHEEEENLHQEIREIADMLISYPKLFKQ